jgi:hypothetical protein
MPVPSQQVYQSSHMVAPPPPPPSAVGGQDQYTEFLALAAVDLAKKGARLHGSLPSYEMVAGYKRKHDEQSAPVLGATHPQQQQQTIVVDSLLLNHVSPHACMITKSVYIFFEFQALTRGSNFCYPCGCGVHVSIDAGFRDVEGSSGAEAEAD